MLSACATSRATTNAPSTATAPTTIAMLGPAETLVPGVPRRFELSIHCGARVLSWKIDDRWWKTEQTADELDWVPAGWPKPTDMGGLTVTLELSTDHQQLFVTYGDTTVTYHPAEFLPTDYCA